MNRSLALFLLISCQLGLVGQGWAQGPIPIVGRVIDGATNQPVPFASVYINASTRGTTADADGKYQLPGVPSGTVELVASAVGYETVRQLMRLGDVKNRRINFLLKPDAISLKAVTVTAKHTGAYNRMLKQFKRELLGDKPAADKCTIVNVNTVALTNTDGHLTATASEPLIIENNALGYRLTYQLLSFDSYRGATYYGGVSRFEAMKAANNEQAERWERNRQRAYLGSSRHLLASLLAGTYEREGFLVFESNYNLPADPSVPIARFGKEPPTKPVRADSLFKAAEIPSERHFYSPKPLEVFYTRQRATTPYREFPYAYSLVHTPKGPATVTTDGWVVHPNGMEMRGELSADRLAILLPADWQPATKRSALPPVTPDQGIVLQADALIDSLESHWIAGQKNAPPVLFLQLDKGSYAPGDRLWFSGLVLDPANQLPVVQLMTKQALPVHIELIAPNGQLLAHQWLRVGEGRLSGSFSLADSLLTGLYRVRAYTENDRLNGRPAFERYVSIGNRLTPGNEVAPTSLSTVADRIEVQFLPEGGQWVAELPTRMGIRAIDGQGRGMPASGRILGSNGSTLGQFNTNAVGIGTVLVTPQANQTYTARVRWRSDSVVVALPAVASSGMTLTADVVTDSTKLVIRIQASAQLTNQLVYLTLQSRGNLVQQTKLLLQNGQARLAIPTAKLPIGVMQVALFDSMGHMQAGRLVCIPDRFRPVVVDVTTDKPTYGPHESVTLSLRVTDGFGDQLALLGSAVVTDAQRVPDDSVEANIRTHLLLTGELLNQTELANEYMSSNEPDVRRVLDNLLLTQDWRRVNWPVAADSQPTTLPAAAGLTVSGQVFDRKNAPLPDANLLLMVSGRATEPFARTARTDRQGRFSVDRLSVTDTATVQVRALTADFKPIAGTQTVLDMPGNYFAADSGTLAKQTDVVPLSVTMPLRTSSPDSVALAQWVSRYGTVEVNVLFDKAARTYPNAYEMMAGNVPGVQVKRRPINGLGTVNSGYTVTLTGTGSPGRPQAMRYLVDGMIVPENDEGTALLMFNLTSVARIAVLKNDAGAGVIAFFSEPDNAPKTRSGEQEPALPLYGYQTDRPFAVPRYDYPADSTAHPPDQRDVVYWQPMLTTGLTGYTTLTFPLSDAARTIRLRVQGITTDGRPVSTSRLIHVR